MTDSPALSDDEALWFPAHMSTGDSFSRPQADDVGDGIGLPGRARGPRPPKKPGIRASSWLWLTLWGAAALGIVTVAARKEIAAEVTQNWLRGQGVHARLKFDRMSLHDVSGHIVVGDPARPELSIDRFDVDYSLDLFGGGGLPLARVKTLHLVHPVMQFSAKGGQLNFGSLDRLVQSALKAPPSAAPPPDSIRVDDAQLGILTDYGLIHARGGVTIDAGRLSDLSLTVPATHISGPMGEGDLSAATVTVHTVRQAQADDRLALKAHLTGDNWLVRGASPVEAADAGQFVHLGGVTADIDARLPYRTSKAVVDAFTGAMQMTLAVKAASLRGAGAALGNAEADLALDGDIKSADKAAGFAGTARFLAHADSVTSGGAETQDVRLSGDTLAVKAGFTAGTGLNLSLGGPVTGDLGQLRQGDLIVEGGHLRIDSLAVTSDAAGAHADFAGAVTAASLTSGDLSLAATTVSLRGAAHSDAANGQWDLGVVSDIVSDRGRYKGLAAVAGSQAQAAADLAARPPTPGVPPPPPPGVPPPPPPGPDSIVALDRAFERFSLRVAKLDVSLSGAAGLPPQIAVRLQGQAVAGLDGGGTATVTPLAGQPLLGSRPSGGFGVRIAGPGLPAVALDVSAFGLTPTGVAGAYALDSTLNAVPVSGVAVSGHGRFATAANGDIRVTLDAPAPITVAAAELGDHLENLRGTVTQTGDAIFVMGKDGWRAQGAFHGFSLSAPNEIVSLTGAEGAFQAFSITGSDATGLKLDLTAATVSDALPAAQRRFNPLALSGVLTQDAAAMTGHFTAATPRVLANGKPAAIAAIDLDSDPKTGKGAIKVHTLDLTFVPHGLQPVALTPTVAAILSKDVSGKLSFDGGFSWDKQTSASSGVLRIDGLDFTGAAGVSHGLKGEIDFTSLTPLLSAPHQMLSVASLQLGVPLSDLELDVQFQGDHLAVEKAEVMSPGGLVVLQPMTVPFDGVSPISGAMTFDGLDFGKILATTGLAGSMSFEGRLSGKLPFVVDGGHVGFIQGFMASDASGMISIRRDSVTGVKATGSVTSPDTTTAPAPLPVDFNPFQDLAFQAMEYLHYDKIDARINSVDGGVLDINFHIKGSFQPPHRQKATISLFDYANGSWMTKPIKLPSGTPVELFLDVPLNLDQILNDLTQFNVNTAQ